MYYMKYLSFFILIALLTSCNPYKDAVLFSSNREGNSDVFVMNKYGRKVKNLSNTSMEEWAPVWVRKNEISFLRQDGPGIKRIKLNLESMEEEEMDHPLQCKLDDKNAVFSPLGVTQVYICNGDVYASNCEDGSARNLTDSLSGTANYVAWTNSENRITFTSNHEGNNDIYFCDVFLGGILNLTRNDANDERGEISPNGHFLVFSTDRFEPGNQDIAMMNLATREITRITETKGNELIARWSKDGKTILYGSDDSGNWEIYAYNLENKTLRRLTKNEAFDGDPRVR